MYGTRGVPAGSCKIKHVHVCVHSIVTVRLYVRRRGLYIVFGAAVDKSLDSMLDAVLQTRPELILVRTSHPRASSTRTMLEIISQKREGYFDRATYQDDMAVEDGLQQAIGRCQENGVIVVCGSLYVAARARQWLAHCHPQLFSPCDWVHHSDNKWEAKETNGNST